MDALPAPEAMDLIDLVQFGLLAHSDADGQTPEQGRAPSGPAAPEALPGCAALVGPLADARSCVMAAQLARQRAAWEEGLRRDLLAQTMQQRTERHLATLTHR